MMHISRLPVSLLSAALAASLAASACSGGEAIATAPPAGGGRGGGGQNAAVPVTVDKAVHRFEDLYGQLVGSSASRVAAPVPRSQAA